MITENYGSWEQIWLVYMEHNKKETATENLHIRSFFPHRVLKLITCNSSNFPNQME